MEDISRVRTSWTNLWHDRIQSTNGMTEKEINCKALICQIGENTPQNEVTKN